MKIFFVLTLVLFFIQPAFTQVFEEKNGIVAVEAEHFFQQKNDKTRKWYIFSEDTKLNLVDTDPSHIETASGNQYIEVLPDTRASNNDKLIQGENFSNEPGKMAVISYKVYFNNPGKYYVWVRAYSTGTEDNGIHVGLNGEWPESGRRMQWCEGKDQWTWASKQRTDSAHCGEERLIFLEIPEKGEHQISFSMREDGFEFDKFILAKEYIIPKSEGIPEFKKKN